MSSRGWEERTRADVRGRSDVVQPGRTILLCVYDKLAPQGGFPAHGFLGASVFVPSLTPDVGEDGLGADVWVP